MARKAKVLGIDEAIDELFKNYKGALTKALKEASDEAEFDIGFEARGCLDRYYENYTPNWYERTETNLIQSFVPYNNVIERGNDMVAIVGMSYDPAKLEGLYYSEASKKSEFNPVNGAWILENYLSGIHPRTNGYPLYNQDDGLIYDPIQDAVSPNETMGEFLKQYRKTFNDNVLLSFAKQIARR